MITDRECNEIADFVVENCNGLYSVNDHAHIAAYAYLHSVYGTLMVVKNEGDIISICRWNMITPTHAKILDFIVRPDFRHKFLAKNMFIKAKMAMPQLETVSFHRKKYAMRSSSYLLDRWIKEKSHGRKLCTIGN